MKPLVGDMGHLSPTDGMNLRRKPFHGLRCISSTRAHAFLAAVNLPQRRMAGERSLSVPVQTVPDRAAGDRHPRVLSAPAYHTRKGCPP